MKNNNGSSASSKKGQTNNDATAIADVNVSIATETFINKEIAKFNITDTAIAEYREQFMPLKIENMNDKEGIEKVHEARMFIVKKRTDIEKKRKELKEDSLKFGRAVDGEAKRITAMLEEIESHLESEEDKVAQEKAKILAEEEKKLTDRFNSRVALLKQNGMTFDEINSTYCFGDTDLSIDSTTVRLFDDNSFNEFINECRSAFGKQQEQKEAERQKAEAEQKRIAELAKEQERVRLEQEEIARKQSEENIRLKAEMDKIEAEKQHIRKAKMESRFAVLSALGMFQFSDCYQYGSVKIMHSKTEELSGEAFQAEVKIISGAIEEIKTAENKKREAEIEKAKQDAIISEQNRLKAEAEAKAEQERKDKEEEERKAQLLPDKEKLIALADAINKIVLPSVKANAAVSIVAFAEQGLETLAENIRKKVKAL